MVDLGQNYTFDPTQVIAGMKEIGKTDELIRDGLRQSGQVAQTALAQAALAAEQYTNKLDAILTESQGSAKATRQFAGEVAGLVKEIRDAAAAQEAARKAAAASADERRKATAAAKEAAKAEKAAAKEVEQAQKAVAAAAKQAAAESDKARGKVGGFFKDALGNLGIPLGIGAAIAAVKAFVGNVVDAAQQTESLLAKLQFANAGNAQAGARDLAFVRAEAARLGLDLQTAGNSYGSFTAAAAAANFPLAEARRLFLATAGASATLKLSADNTQGVLLALTQILSKGSVQAEELRGQIGERLPGAFAIAARSMGVTEAQLNKLLATGKVTAQDFLPKFARELEKTFGDGTEAAAEATTSNLNRISNEFSAFFLRFEGVASSSAGVFARFLGRINDKLDTFTVAGRLRQAQSAIQGQIKDYGNTVDTLLTQAGEQAKKAGTDAGFAIGVVVAQQSNLLQQQLKDAEKANELFNSQTKEGLNFKLYFKGSDDDYKAARAQSLQRVELLRAEIAVIEERGAAARKANKEELDTLGLIAKQEQLIKDLKVRQKNATQENKGDGTDFLFGKGGLNEALKAAEKELDRLQGKIDKSAAARASKLDAALKALAAERARLTEKAAQANIKEADDAAERARLAFRESLSQIDIIKQKLIEREAAVRKAGGRGANADGAIDGVQAQALTQLRLAALDEYYTSLYKITAAREQRLFDLRADSDQKEVEAIDRKYDRLIKASTDGIERQAIEEARQREQLALKFEQQAKKDARVSESSRLTIQLAEQAPGISPIDARRAANKALLEQDIRDGQKQLNNSLLLSNEEGRIARQQAELKIALAKNAIKEIEKEKAAHAPEDFLFKLILGDGEGNNDKAREALKQATAEILNNVTQVLDAEAQAAATRVQRSDQAINELSTQIQAQIALREEGSASNIKGLIAEQDKQKALRREALEEQRKIAKEKVLLDTLTQASSVATAVANVLAEVAFPYNLIAAAALVGSFVYTKAQAFEAASKQPAGYFTGGFTPDGGKYEEAGVVHKGEFVANQELTKEHRALFEALHMGRRLDGDAMASLAPLLPAMPETLLPDYSLPERLRSQQQQYNEQRHGAGIGQLDARLAAIERTNQQIQQSNQQMAEAPTVTPLGPDKVELRWANGNVKVVTYTS